MTTRAQRIRLGIFMTVALLFLLGSVATLAGLKLWNPKDRYTVAFRDSVSGLEVGSTVRMKGVRVGQVEKISIDSTDVERVVVTLSLEPDTPVKTDTRAVPTAQGITGLLFVELTGGSKAAPRLPPNTAKSIIAAGESTLQSLTGKATDIAKKMEAVLNNLLDVTREGNRTRFRRLLENAAELASAMTQVVGGDTPRRVRRILANIDRATVTLEKTAQAISAMTTTNSERIGRTLAAAEGVARTLNRKITLLKPQETLDDISRAAKAIEGRVNSRELSGTITELNKAATHIGVVAKDLSKLVRAKDRKIDAILIQLDGAARDLKEFARAIRDRPSLLLRGETRSERRVP
ncbi:MAG: MCE family protein [Deltaproteobacteria bacterium]|nr:MCE family protein [Deltaproteobacteria bacterium]